MAPSDTTFRRDPEVLSWPPAGLYGVVKTRGLIPWIIRRATRGQFDHAFVILEDGAIIEAEPGGVKIGHLSEYYRNQVAINSDEEITVQQRAVVVATARAMVGKPYNDLAIADDGLESFGWHWRRLLKWASGDGEVVCSQLVAIAGQAAGLDWRGGAATATETTPAMLARRPGMQPWRYPE